MKNLLDIGISARGFVETEELQKIIDRAESGETIFFGSSKNGDGEEYAILQPLVIRKSITIEGDNPTVRIKQWGNNPTFLIQPDSPDQVIIVKNIHIESGSIGIQVSSSFRLSELSEIRNVKFTAQSTASIKVESPDVNITIKNINVYGSYDGLWLSSSTAFNKLSIEDSVFKSIQNRAISLDKAISSFSGNVSFDKVGIIDSKDSIFLNNFIVTGSNTFFQNVQQTVISSGSSAFVSPGAGGGGGPPTAHASTHLSGGADAIPLATTSSSGLMSAADKSKSDATSPYVLLLKPSGTLGAGTFGDWTSLYNFYTTLGDAPCKILFDSSLLGGDAIIIPSGTYEINRATSLEAASYSGGATFLIFSGATFSRFNSVLALAIINTGSYPVLTISGADFGEITSFGGNSFLQARGTAPVIKARAATVIAGNSTFTVLSGNYQAIEIEYPGYGSPIGCALVTGQGYKIEQNSIRTAGVSEFAYFPIIQLTNATENISLDQPDYSSIAGSLNSIANSFAKERHYYVGEVNSNFDSGSFLNEGGYLTIDSSGGALSGSLPQRSIHILKGSTVAFKKVSNDSNEIQIFPISGSGDTIDGQSSGSMSAPYSLREYMNLGDGRWILINKID